MLDEQKELCSWCKGSGEVYSPGDTERDSPTFERCPACAGLGLGGMSATPIKESAYRAIDAALKAIEAHEARRYPKQKG